jgi:hypothetical protein
METKNVPLEELRSIVGESHVRQIMVKPAQDGEHARGEFLIPLATSEGTLVASYNRGMRGLEKALENQQVDNYYDLMLNEETARYVFRILACKEIIENPKKYGFRIDESHLYSPLALRYVAVNSDVNDLVSFAKKQGITYKKLKWYNPWLQDDKLKVSRGKTYQIAIPNNTDEDEMEGK